MLTSLFLLILGETWRLPLADNDILISWSNMVNQVNMATSENETLLIVDSKRRQLVFFGPDGKIITRSGTRGRGPGELSSPKVLGWVGTKKVFMIIDEHNSRISSWTEDGKFVEEFSFIGEFLRKAAYKDESHIFFRKAVKGTRGWQLAIFEFDKETQSSKPFWQMTSKEEDERPYVLPVTHATIAMQWHPRIHFVGGSDFLAVNYNSKKIDLLDLESGKKIRTINMEIPDMELGDTYYEFVMHSFNERRGHVEKMSKRPEMWGPVSHLNVDGEDKIWAFGQQFEPYSKSRFYLYNKKGNLLKSDWIEGIGQTGSGNAVFSLIIDKDNYDEIVLIKYDVSASGPGSANGKHVH